MKYLRISTLFNVVLSNLGNPFRLDYRSLAFYRVVIGLVLLADMIMRWVDLTVHYTNKGVVSAELAAQSYASFSFSFHDVVDASWWVILLFTFQTAFAVCLIVGYRTRTAMLLSFVFMVSLQNRNSVILNGGDVLLRTQLFWSIFLPMNRYFSLDLAAGRVSRAVKKTTFSPATAAIVIQSALVFWQTAALKSGVAWRETYEALYITLNAEAFSNPIGTWLSQFRVPMRMITWVSIVIEDIAPILLVTPFFTRYARIAVLVLVVGLYGGIISTMSVGIFPFIGIGTLLVVIPGSAWDRLSHLIHSWRKQPVLTVYYDVSCGICTKFVRLLSAFMLTQDVVVKSIYDSKQITAISNKQNSWVGKVGRTYYYKADVFIEILRRSALWWLLAPIIGWRPVHSIATYIYGFISSRRKSICKPAKAPSRLRIAYMAADRTFTFVGQGFILVMLLSVIVWVRSDMPEKSHVRVTGIYYTTMRTLRLDQYWNMFAPTPLSYNSWPVVEGVGDGGNVDAWRPYWDDTSYEVSFEKPEHSYERYVSPRWRRYITRISSEGGAQRQQEFLAYMCSDWNQKYPGNPVTSLSLIEMVEETNTTGGAETAIKNVRASYFCQ